MDELIQKVMDKTGIDAEKAKSAIGAVAGFLQDKLPGPVGAQVAKLLGGDNDGGDDDGDAGGMMDQAKGMLGGLMGN